ncbi:MAG: glycosyltransferase [Salinivirgaceae bacterium]|nr:glycosyltransferase [Salinivirgaceae bacterium]
MEQYLNSLSLGQLITLAFMAFALLVQVLYYLCVCLRTAGKKQQLSSNQPPVSVVICARNEGENLKMFLPKILEQNYPDFEVIVVSDCSEDDTLTILAELELTHKNLRHTSIESDRKFTHGKKLAVTIGLKSAKNEHIVLIDADCYPVSPNWLASIMSAYTDGTEIVLGYGGYEPRKGLLNKLIRFDTLNIAMQYIGWAKAGHPYMGVGRNISYTRRIFFEKNGFQSHYHLMSGDDDLFVNERANKLNTKTITSADSIVESLPCETFQQWVKQKKRHLSTWTHYRFGTKIILSYELLSRVLFYSVLMVAIFGFNLYIEAAAAYGFRLIVQLIVYKMNMRKLCEQGFLLLIPIFDIILPVLQLAFNILNLRDYRSNEYKSKIFG